MMVITLNNVKARIKSPKNMSLNSLSCSFFFQRSNIGKGCSANPLVDWNLDWTMKQNEAVNSETEN